VGLEGTDQQLVCFSLRRPLPQPPEVVVLDHEGRLREQLSVKAPSPQADRVRLWSRDLAGDGNDALLFVDGGRVRATRGGTKPEQQLWTWALPGNSDEASDLQIVDIHAWKDSPATVVVQSLRHNAIYGLDGVTGRLLWRGRTGSGEEPTAHGTPLFAASPDVLPRIVTSRPGRDTICRRTLTAGPDGTYRLSAAEPRAYDPAPNDPRTVRLLPWAKVWNELSHSSWLGSLKPFALSVAVLIVPYLLVRAFLRRRSRWRVLALFLWIVLTWEVIRDYLDQLIVPGVMPESARWLVVLIAWPLVGLPFIILAWITLSWSLRRRWRRLTLIPGVFVIGSALVAGVLLWVDREGKDAEQTYGWAGWYQLWLPGLFAAGMLLMAGYVLGGTGRLLWRVGQRVRKWLTRTKAVVDAGAT
jgi:hypothetical protein